MPNSKPQTVNSRLQEPENGGLPCHEQALFLGFLPLGVLSEWCVVLRAQGLGFRVWHRLHFGGCRFGLALTSGPMFANASEPSFTTKYLPREPEALYNLSHIPSLRGIGLSGSLTKPKNCAHPLKPRVK